MFCAKCGADNVQGAQFCVSCGVDLSSITPAMKTNRRSAADTLDAYSTIVERKLYDGMMLAGQYKVIGSEPLGAGGMGEVWKAQDTELGTTVAIKLLPSVLARDRSAIENLKHEAMIGQQLTHQSICRLYGFHGEGEIKFIVMEYVDGKTLKDVLKERNDRKLAWSELKPWAIQIAMALNYAHSAPYRDQSGKLFKGVLHRDIKPANIMIAKEGPPKLMDFGIAREIHNTMTQLTGRTSQTPMYASPEQFRGQPVNVASDVYSFTSVLYECLAGLPFVSPSGSLEYQILQKEFEPLGSQPDEVNAILASGLAKDPSKRTEVFGTLIHAFENSSVGCTGTSLSLEKDIPRLQVNTDSKIDSSVIPRLKEELGLAAEIGDRVSLVGRVFGSCVSIGDASHITGHVVAPGNINVGSNSVIEGFLISNSQTEFAGRQCSGIRCQVLSMRNPAYIENHIIAHDDLVIPNDTIVAKTLVFHNKARLGSRCTVGNIIGGSVEVGPNAKLGSVTVDDECVIAESANFIDVQAGSSVNIAKMSSGKCVISKANIDICENCAVDYIYGNGHVIIGDGCRCTSVSGRTVTLGENVRVQHISANTEIITGKKCHIGSLTSLEHISLGDDTLIDSWTVLCLNGIIEFGENIKLHGMPVLTDNVFAIDDEHKLVVQKLNKGGMCLTCLINHSLYNTILDLTGHTAKLEMC